MYCDIDNRSRYSINDLSPLEAMTIEHALISFEQQLEARRQRSEIMIERNALGAEIEAVNHICKNLWSKTL